MKSHLYHFLRFINKPYRMVWAIVNPEVYKLHFKRLYYLCQRQEVRKLTIIEKREKRRLEWIIGIPPYLNGRWLANNKIEYLRICRLPKMAAQLLKEYYEKERQERQK